MADLESTANEVVQLESRAEAAENERDEALAQLRATTPRPSRSWDELQALAGEQGGAMLAGSIPIRCCVTRVSHPVPFCPGNVGTAVPQFVKP